MRKTIALATFAALTAGAVGVGAVDNLPQMVGSDTLKQVTIDVINGCSAAVKSSITYAGTGSGAGQNALLGGTQGVAPMSRSLNSGICSSAARTASEGIVIGLDGVNIVGEPANTCTGITHTGGTNGDPNNDWRTTLRQIYAGMSGTGSDINTRDCNSQARKDLVANWDAIFNEDCSTKTCATDSHPNFVGAAPNNYDANNLNKEPGLRHAFRRDEESGTTDVFLGLLNLPTISFGQARPAGTLSGCSASATTLDGVFRVLSNSIFCNVHRPTDTYSPTFVPGNTALGEAASFIPEIQDLGNSPCTGGDGKCPEDGGTGTHLPGYDHDANPATPPRWVVPNSARYYPEMQDQDPIRRKCVGTAQQTSGAAATPVNLPAEQVCSAVGQLGDVLAINPPPIAVSDAYYTTECKGGKSDFGPAVTTATGAGLRCPNGDKAVGAPAQCRLPQAADGSFNCLNRGGLWAGANFTGLGGPGVLDDNAVAVPTKAPGCASDISVGAPAGMPVGTRSRTSMDGRAYNLVLRASGINGTNGAGEPLTIHRPTNLTTAADVPLVGSFYRIHSNRSLLNGTAAGATPLDKTCQKIDATRQIGCLVQSSPCSIGYAGGEAVDENPGTVAIQVNGVNPTVGTIRNLVTGGFPVYPFARKLYVNSLRGFDSPLLAPVTTAPSGANDQQCVPAGGGACTVAVPSVNPTNCDLQSGTASVPQCCCDDSQSPSTGPDLESVLVQCFEDELPGTILANRGFFSLPGDVEICEDFNEAATCGNASNSDACAGNVLIPAGNCTNALRDGAETDVDCGGVTCSTKCSAGKACVLGTDCASGNCTGKLCQ